MGSETQSAEPRGAEGYRVLLELKGLRLGGSLILPLPIKQLLKVLVLLPEVWQILRTARLEGHIFVNHLEVAISGVAVTATTIDHLPRFLRIIIKGTMGSKVHTLSFSYFCMRGGSFALLRLTYALLAIRSLRWASSSSAFAARS